VSTYDGRSAAHRKDPDDDLFFPSSTAGAPGSTYNASGHDPDAEHFAEPSDKDAGFDASGFSDLDSGGTTSVMQPGGAGYGTGMPTGDFGGRDPYRWHGGADFGLLVLRLVLGGTFAANGLQHLFGLFHGVGRVGFEHFLTTAGYQHVNVLSWVAGGTELVAGALVVLGLFTPIAAAGMLGLVANLVALEWPVGFFGAGGYEFALVLGAAAFALLFAGPGRVSLDRPTPWYRRPVLNGFLFLIIGAASAVIVLMLLRHR
jgi:putative oxidoreductase